MNVALEGVHVMAWPPVALPLHSFTLYMGGVLFVHVAHLSARDRCSLFMQALKEELKAMHGLVIRTSIPT